MTKTKKPLTKSLDAKPFGNAATNVKTSFKKTKRGKKVKGRFKNNEESLKLYQEVAKVLDNMKDGEISFKDAFFKSNTQTELNVYAIASKAVHNWKILNQIVDESGILIENPGENKNTIKAIIADYLWGCKRIIGKEWIFDIVRGKKDELDEIKQKFGNFHDKKRTTELTFVKVNTIKYTVESFKKFLEEQKFQCIKTPQNYANFMDLLSKLKSKSNTYMIDYHFKDLFVFSSSAKSKICQNSIFQNKFITIQDKSSLIPVSLLNVEAGSKVLDMCAAPGMKTVYLAAQLQGRGEILAVDRDKKRYQTLVNMIKSFGASKIVKAHHNDVLKFECDEESMDYVLLDAPCSGSGIRDRLGDTSSSKERLKSLQWLQHKMLTQALTKYTNAKRIVYSTCSKFTEENEAVIEMTLKKLDDVKFKLMDCHQLIKGYGKGSSEYEFGSLCLRVNTEKDYSNGFFTAVFENVNNDGEINTNKKRSKKIKLEKDKMSEEENSEDDSDGEDFEENESEDANSDHRDSETSEEEESEDANSDHQVNEASEEEEEESENSNSEEENSKVKMSVDNDSEDENSDGQESVDSVENMKTQTQKRKILKVKNPKMRIQTTKKMRILKKNQRFPRNQKV